MSEIKIKICGLQRMEDVDMVNTLHPDYVGFIINYPKSHRSKTPQEVENLANKIATDIQKVGVFVDEPIETPVQLVQKGIIDMVQLHGKEDEAYIQRLREQCDCIIMKAFLIRNREDIASAAQCSADYVLLDAGRGSGETFDWSHIPKDFPKPYFLAGGISAENIDAAYEATGAYALDVSSGVETDGYKDAKKMEAILAWRDRKEGQER
ncbi:MAG: phosphoribosylanthranilate isomerase [Lachnospiraceae bacterium]|nr:phosphoribosylanthranilate isomerase [Lachnospiraceae bacterium]MBQ2578866.1 phosphoribosylanthranilate isomerase [Lachnospiraceae bacterium]MBQ5385673.1 phosphoribosylanthranilate isomerase [Lachnospiraceae bacterium]